MRYLIAFAVLLCSCATVKTCTQPVTSQALQDGASVLTCAAGGKPLAQCEDAQLQVEAGQLTADVLMCGESAIVAAASQVHTGASCAADPSNPSCLPPVHDARAPR